jgi:hypothetical protein
LANAAQSVVAFLHFRSRVFGGLVLGDYAPQSVGAFLHFF